MPWRRRQLDPTYQRRSIWVPLVAIVVAFVVRAVVTDTEDRLAAFLVWAGVYLGIVLLAMVTGFLKFGWERRPP